MAAKYNGQNCKFHLDTNCYIEMCSLCWYITTMKTENSPRFSLYKLAEYLFQLCLGVYMHITYFTVKCFVLKACVSFIHRSFAFYACPGKGFYGSTSIPSFQHSFVLSPWRQEKWETETTLVIGLHSLFYFLFKVKLYEPQLGAMCYPWTRTVLVCIRVIPM